MNVYDPDYLNPERRSVAELKRREDERVAAVEEHQRNRQAEMQARMASAAEPVGDPFTVVEIRTGQYTDRYAGKGEGVDGIYAALATASKRGKVPTLTAMSFTTVYSNPNADLAIVAIFAGYDAQCIGGWTSFQLDADGSVDSSVDFK
jgi:hypothetical protein